MSKQEKTESKLHELLRSLVADCVQDVEGRVRMYGITPSAELSVKLRDAVEMALRSEEFSDEVSKLIKHEAEQYQARVAKLVRLARLRWEDQDVSFDRNGIEIDADAKTSPTDENGAWVQAWCWFSYEGTEFEKK